MFIEESFQMVFVSSIRRSVRMPVLVTQRVSRACSVPRVTGASMRHMVAPFSSFETVYLHFNRFL